MEFLWDLTFISRYKGVEMMDFTSKRWDLLLDPVYGCSGDVLRIW